MKQKGFVPIIILVLIIALAAVGFFIFKNLRISGTSPTPTATPIEASQSASQSKQTGTVTGKLCYPSEFLPAGEIVAKNIITGKIYTQTYPGIGEGTSDTYRFELSPGTYHLRYQAHPSGNNPSLYISEYNTACATNNAYNFCLSDSNHKIIETVVESGKDTPGVNLCDSGTTQEQEKMLNDSF